MNNPANLPKKICLVSDSMESSIEMIGLLRSEGFRVDHEVNRQNLCSSILNAAPDLVLLDFAFQEIDDLEICRDIRSKYQCPLVIVSERHSDMLHITALTYGADDFIGKPFNPSLFIARISSLLRRIDRLMEKNSSIIRFRELTIDACRREVIFQGSVVNLTSIEFDVLSYLVNNAGRVVSRKDIYLALYNREYNGYDRSIDIYISRIRQKIGDDQVTPRYLRTVRGAGYLFIGHKE